jgi:hypothetical protein
MRYLPQSAVDKAMFELEMLVAFGIGAGLMALAPAVSAVTGGSKLSRSMAETGRDLTKRGLKVGVVVADKVSEVTHSMVHNVSEIGESFNDLVAEARADLVQERAAASSNGAAIKTVTEVTVEG